MEIKKIFIVLLVMRVVLVDATYEISRIITGQGLSLENAQAVYGKNETTHGPITEHLQKNSSENQISLNGLDSSVGKKSQGFNGFIVHDDQGAEYKIQFDWQNGYRLQSGRAKKTAVTVDLGKYDANPAMSVARIELVKDGDILSSHVKNYKNVGTKFSIVLGKKDGKYSVELSDDI